jgi:hypothetical protein
VAERRVVARRRARRAPLGVGRQVLSVSPVGPTATTSPGSRRVRRRPRTGLSLRLPETPRHRPRSCRASRPPPSPGLR